MRSNEWFRDLRGDEDLATTNRLANANHRTVRIPSVSHDQLIPRRAVVGERASAQRRRAAEGSKEEKASWTAFLRYLKERGLKGVRLFVSDKCLGLIAEGHSRVGGSRRSTAEAEQVAENLKEMKLVDAAAIGE